MANPGAWLEKTVSLNVAWVDLPQSADSKDGYKVLRAETISSNTYGGYITLLVNPEAFQRIVNLCGTQHYKDQIGVVPHMVNGVFSKDGDNYVLKVDK